MLVSVIIPVKNDNHRLTRCLIELCNQTCGIYFEVVVIDNNDRPSNELKNLCEHFGAVYDYEPRPGSYAARNRGLLVSKGDLIAFTDSDCQPVPTWIYGGLTAFKDENVKAIAGHIEFTFSRKPIPIGELIDSFTHLDQERYARSGYGACANLWVRRECFDKVGMFNDEMQNLGDREWGQRARGYGVKVEYSPLPIVNHPARNLPQLMRKLWKQGKWKHYLSPFVPSDIVPSSRVPRQNYIQAFRDPELQGIRPVLFLAALHLIGIMQAVRITMLLMQLPQSKPQNKRSQINKAPVN